MSGTIGNNPYRASGVVAAAAGAGGVTWCSAIKTGAFCAEAGNGYFINTCGGTFEVTLPAAAEVGDLLHFTDYARTWGTACKELTLNQNSLKFQGNTTPKPEYDTAGATVKIVYSGATQGWIPQLDKGTTDEVPQSMLARYMVIGGGGSGGWGRSGGGGAGGSRTVASIPAGLTLCKGTPYTVTVGAGGAVNGPGGSGGPGGCSYGYHGVDSVFASITSAGGGAGSYNGTPYPPAQQTAIDGGSGGGGGFHASVPATTGGIGNTPPTPCTQGYPGGTGTPNTAPNPGPGRSGGGGGGGQAAGTNAATPGGKGGLGDTTDIFGSTPTAPSYGTCGPAPGRYFAGGGGGGNEAGTAGVAPDGGGGSAGTNTGTAGNATVNTGGGGGGSGEASSTAGAGGSGIVLIRRLTACSCSTDGNAVLTCGSDTIHVFTGDGTFTP